MDSILLLPKLPDSIICKTYNDVGIYHATIGDYDSAIRYFEKSYAFDPNCGVKTKANILCNIANTQKLFGKYDLAIANLHRSKKLYGSISDEKNLLKIESEICSVYYSKSDFNKALEISSELLPKLEALGDKKLLNIQLLRQANIEFNVGDFENAIVNYNKTLPYFGKDIDNNLQNKYVAIMNIGSCYSELGKSKALHYFSIALKGFRVISDSRNEFFCMGRIGKYYYKIKNYKKATPYLKKSFDYMYANLPHISLEIFTFYLNSLQKQNSFSEIEELLALDAAIMLSQANLQEKIFYYETLATLYGKFGDKASEYSALKSLQTLYAERQKENTFEELQKKLNQYNIKNEINKNRNLELQVSNLKLQNTIIWILILFTVLLISYFFDKYKKKNKIQGLILMQLQQEKELNEQNNLLKDEQLKLEGELLRIKERELTALQLKIFQIKSNIIDFLQSNIIKTNDKELKNIIVKIESFFNNDDYWREFEIRFTNMHPDFTIKIKKTYPVLTKKDIDFLSLIKLNLNNKEIATLINISYESVISKKYLLRKKMNFSSENELVEYVNEL
ncbi:LuxR C-terminal-related transcriptional regulator [Flavobacterium chungnamense]|uniref:tetratricopeptide repeat protein n=1 Tax=Flavobacterium chungnamense TaxID=706182 RepID=UPI0031EA9A21